MPRDEAAGPKANGLTGWFIGDGPKLMTADTKIQCGAGTTHWADEAKCAANLGQGGGCEPITVKNQRRKDDVRFSVGV